MDHVIERVIDALSTRLDFDKASCHTVVGNIDDYSHGFLMGSIHQLKAQSQTVSEDYVFLSLSVDYRALLALDAERQYLLDDPLLFKLHQMHKGLAITFPGDFSTRDQALSYVAEIDLTFKDVLKTTGAEGVYLRQSGEAMSFERSADAATESFSRALRQARGRYDLMRTAQVLAEISAETPSP